MNRPITRRDLLKAARNSLLITTLRGTETSPKGTTRLAGAQPRHTAKRRTMAAPTLNNLRLQAVDLRTFIRLGVNHLYNGAIDRRRQCLPFVRFNLTNAPAWARHEYWGSPHMVGRFLDALAISSRVIDLSPDEDADNALRKLLQDCLNNPAGLAFDTLPGPDGKRSAAMHHCREVLLGLVGLQIWKGCERSASLARELVRTIERVTRQTGTFPAGMLYQDGWARFKPDELNSTSGRLIGALVKYYRVTKDDLAIDLAKRFAEINIQKTFTPEGELTDLAGTHLHSTEGTMTALIDLGVLTGDKRYFEIGRRLYDVGLRRWRTSYGWARESRGDLTPDRGEANNTGDFIEAALILGINGHPQYFREAESMIRNGLLASQILNTDWIIQSSKKDTDDYAYSDIRRRARGGFAFTTPNSYHSYNTDLMGGALQSLCEAYHAIVSRDAAGCHLNMLFSGNSPWLTVRSTLPEAGRLELQTLQPGDLFVRMPEWVKQDQVRVSVNDRTQPSQWKESELVIQNCPSNSHVQIGFDQTTRHTRELAPGYKSPFEIDWIGDTIVAMEPRSPDRIALY